VRDRDHGPSGDQSIERFLNLMLGFGIDAAGRFVENQDSRAMQDGAGNRNPLPFAAGKSVSSFADDGIISVRRAADEIVGIGGPGSSNYVAEQRLRNTVSDILDNGA